MADPTDAPEEWRPVVGYEGRYEVSSLGRVRSLAGWTWVEGPQRRGFWRRRFGRMLKASVGVNGYRYVQLGWPQVGRTVHSVVCEAFIGPRPTPDTYVRHLDGNRTNNTITNLTYGTAAENTADMLRHGTHVVYRGEESTRCVYSDEQLASAFAMIERGATIKAAAASIGIDPSYLGKIRTKERRASFDAPDGEAA